MKILVTGAAGFIGSFLTEALLERGDEVVGLDNLNDYYAVSLKLDRLKRLGIEQVLGEGRFVSGQRFPMFRFIRMDLADRESMERLFRDEQFDVVCNLAAQAGVRYSIENPYSYIQSNVVGFLNVLEGCRHTRVKHLVYASSSSVYGMAEHVPFRETDQADRPVSLYGATKKADELMAHAYSKLYRLPTTGLRYFTVYGPWGRPDMAPCLFLKEILTGGTIQVFNHGDMQRDFTFIQDVVEATLRIIDRPESGEVPYTLYNIGNSSPIALMDFIHTLERCSGREVRKEYREMQSGDVQSTFADTTRLERNFGFMPATSIGEGVRKFYDWYVEYYHSSSGSSR